MKIALKEITVGEVFSGFSDQGEEGVVGYGGRLDIRPKYQREFVYKEKQRDAVIHTLRHGFPLNVMYWAKTHTDRYELLDGQQRTLSICQYLSGTFSFQRRYFHNLQDDEQQQILNYKLMIYICEGTDSEKLDWFRTINIAGEKLSDQELRNAIYAGAWVSDAKRYFSKSGSPATRIAGIYLQGAANRQEHLETAILWISTNKDNKGTCVSKAKERDPVAAYMAYHQHDENANDLWLYFQQVIAWVKVVFPTYRKEMKGINWGDLYEQYHEHKWDATKLETEIKALMKDEDVRAKKGIYPYVLSRNKKHLNLRSFSDNQKREVYEQQGGICPICKQQFDINDMEADHITPWSEGGKTDVKNCQMLCKEDNRRKSNK